MSLPYFSRRAAVVVAADVGVYGEPTARDGIIHRLVVEVVDAVDDLVGRFESISDQVVDVEECTRELNSRLVKP